MTSDEYQQSMRELARAATMPETVAARLEAELQRAFGAARVASETSPRMGWLIALAAAAALIIAVSAAVWFARQPVAPGNVMAGPKAGTTDAAGLKSATPDAAGLKTGAPDAGGLKSGAANAVVAARSPRPGPGTDSRRSFDPQDSFQSPRLRDFRSSKAASSSAWPCR